MPKHRAGGKYSGSHTTIIDAAEVVADTAAKLKEVSKIILGMIKVAPSKQARLKITVVPAGLEVVVYGRISLQTIFVYTKDTKNVQSAIERAFR
ncbi:MAG: DUF2103 domain-containing protein [Candidatus Magasanikbacteria bacterium]|jgi:hypothetical protein